MQLSRKQKQILRWVGFPVLALVTFVFAVHLTFPYDRIKDRIITTLSPRYEVNIKDVSPTLLPGGLVLEGVALKARPKPGASEEDIAKITGVYLDRVRLDLGLWAAMRQRVDLDVEVDVGNGGLEGNLQISDLEVKAEFSTDELPLQDIPGLASAVGLPMEGGLEATLSLTLPENRWDKADGIITLVSCTGCTIGDGQQKIKPRAPTSRRRRRGALFASEGLTVPKLDLGTLSGKVVIEGGRAQIKDFSAKSKDGELQVDATLRFARDFKNSTIQSGCIRFKLTDDLKRREPQFGNVPDLMRLAPQPDGYSNLKPSPRPQHKKLVQMRWIAAQECDLGGSDSDRNDRDRPTISATKPPTRPELPTREAPSPPDEVEQPVEADRPTDVEQQGGEVRMPAPGSSGPDLSKTVREAAQRATDDVRAPDPDDGAREGNSLDGRTLRPRLEGDEGERRGEEAGDPRDLPEDEREREDEFDGERELDEDDDIEEEGQDEEEPRFQGDEDYER